MDTRRFLLREPIYSCDHASRTGGQRQTGYRGKPHNFTARKQAEINPQEGLWESIASVPSLHLGRTHVETVLIRDPPLLSDPGLLLLLLLRIWVFKMCFSFYPPMCGGHLHSDV